MEQPRGREDMCGGKWMVARDDKRQLQYINYNSEKVTIVFSLDQMDFFQRTTINRIRIRVVFADRPKNS